MTEYMDEQLTLGQLTYMLSDVVWDGPIYIEVGDTLLVPEGLSSWRGVYHELAINYSSSGVTSAEKFRDWLIDAIGHTFYGWKGGEFVMDTGTPLWVDNEGEYNRIAVVGLDSEEDFSYIRTKKFEW